MRTSYESNLIASASYDQSKRELEVELRTGEVYRYADVPPEEAEAFASASSKGGFFNQFIRGKYATTRVESGPEAPQNSQVPPGLQIQDNIPCSFLNKVPSLTFLGSLPDGTREWACVCGVTFEFRYSDEHGNLIIGDPTFCPSCGKS